MTQSPFHKHFEALMKNRAPDPLTRSEAIEKAMVLRVAGLPYTSVAIVMRVYHGQTLTGATWRKLLRAKGLKPEQRGCAENLRKGSA